MAVKICPLCQEENAADAVLCKKCFAAIRSVQPVSADEEKIKVTVSSTTEVSEGKKNSSDSFACNNFHFSTADIETITNIIYQESKYLNPEYRNLIRKITLIHSEDDESYENIEANAYAWWDDSINEKGPHIQITEGLVALLIPIAAMYLRGLRGKKLVIWINHFANKMVEFDGNIPIGTRELGKAMLAEIIAHETAHIIKKHGPVKARYAGLSSEQQKELQCNFERDADMTALKIIETTPFAEDFYLGSLLSSLALYAPQCFQGEKGSHPADKERMNNLLVNGSQFLLNAGISQQELSEYIEIMLQS